MKYIVGVVVNGCVEVEVEASSFDEAKALGNKVAGEMDFGELRDIDWQAITAEDGNGNFQQFTDAADFI